jgi:hypothetical protein
METSKIANILLAVAKGGPQSILIQIASDKGQNIALEYRYIAIASGEAQDRSIPSKMRRYTLGRGAGK